MQSFHARVTRRFSQNRRGSDGRHFTVTANDGLRRAIQYRAFIAIDQRPARRGRDSSHRPLHREQTGLKNIEAIDLLDTGFGNRPGQRLVADFLRQFDAAFSGKFFGVI